MPGMLPGTIEGTSWSSSVPVEGIESAPMMPGAPGPFWPSSSTGRRFLSRQSMTNGGPVRSNHRAARGKDPANRCRAVDFLSRHVQASGRRIGPLQARKALLYAPRSRTFVRLFLGSSAVEHSTVNRMVAGSNPARGAKSPANIDTYIADASARARMLRFAGACTKDDAVSARSADTPHALRILSNVRFCDRPPENGRWSGASE
jgi:hypothetical protein